MSKIKDMDDFVDNLQDLLDSRKLLNDILRHYDCIKHEIIIPDHEKETGLKIIRHESGAFSYAPPTLVERIEKYKDHE
jgi:hypothetical protein